MEQTAELFLSDGFEPAPAGGEAAGGEAAAVASSGGGVVHIEEID